jgi:probable phosphoglycerate mutase
VRLADALRQVVDTHPDNTIVIVGHDSTNRALLLQALGLPLSAFWRIAQDPCALSEIVVNDDGTTVQRMNETAHLAPIVNSLA